MPKSNAVYKTSDIYTNMLNIPLQNSEIAIQYQNFCVSLEGTILKKNIFSFPIQG